MRNGVVQLFIQDLQYGARERDQYEVERSKRQDSERNREKESMIKYFKMWGLSNRKYCSFGEIGSWRMDGTIFV